jgi:hypothetical protein
MARLPSPALLTVSFALLACERGRVQTHPEAIVAHGPRSAPDVPTRALDASIDVARAVIPPAPEAVRDVPHERPLHEPQGGRCERDEDCPGVERCFDEALQAQYSRVFRDCAVARAWQAAHPINHCFRPACTDDEQCPTGRRCGQAPMVPFPDRACLPASCRWDAQCHRGSILGQCAPYQAGRPCEQGGWHCVFPDDPCSPIDPARRCRPVDGVIAYCVPVNGRFRCVTEEPSP